MRTLVRVLDYSPCLHRIASPFARGVVRPARARTGKKTPGVPVLV
jgi:hypothetical protein